MRNIDFIHQRWFRVLQHLVFWTASFLVLLRIFRSGPEIHEVDVLYTALFHVFLVPPVYLNLRSFVHQLQKKWGWVLYVLKLALVIALFSWLNLMFFQDWSAALFPGHYFISYYTWVELALFIFIYVALTTLIKGTRSWFTVTRLRAEMEEMEKEKVQMELSALKSQVNPHFLFNTLNGIYSMTLAQDGRLPSTVLQLSDLMRYFLYEAGDEWVPLEKEVSLLKNYIALQKIRLGDHLSVNLELPENLNGQRIAPLLLITFVENAFKHGDKQRKKGNFLEMKLETQGGGLDFRIANYKGKVDETGEEKYGGIGLENVKRRLALLYPGKHSLAVKEDDQRFYVELKLYEA